jgi:hypothetical protein
MTSMACFHPITTSDVVVVQSLLRIYYSQREQSKASNVQLVRAS